MTAQTPMMAQWNECKKEAKEALLFFRLGDFYEAFYEDAKIMSKICDLTLTQRQGIPMCGAPYHSCERYIDQLISKGYKVAIAEQIEDPTETKGIVKRKVIRTITPGTLVTSQLLKEKSNNFFISIAQIGLTYGLAIIDLTTSDFRVLEVEDTQELIDELHRLRPAEILVSNQFAEKHPEFFTTLSHSLTFLLNKKENWFFDHPNAHACLTTHFSSHSLDGFGLKGMAAATCAAGALIAQLKNELNFNLDHIRTIQRQSLSQYMGLDRITLCNLELLQPLHEKTESNTLLSYLDFTSTSMGGRMLADWIKHPLLCPLNITKRQDVIAHLIEDRNKLNQLRGYLQKIRDLERLIMKITSGFATPRDILSLRLSLEVIPKIKTLLNNPPPLLQELKEGLVDVSATTEKIAHTLTDTPPLRIFDGNVIRKGINATLDEYRTISQDSKTWIANYQNELRSLHDIKTLKVGYNKVFGYYIEVSKSQADRMPNTFERRQTLVNSERFLSLELKQFEHKILSAEDRIKAIELEIWNDLRKEVAKAAPLVHTIAKSIAQIDTLASLSRAAREYSLNRPIVDDSHLLNIQAGRHPIIERVIGRTQFIPNDTLFDSSQQLYLITGPNMAGKSTYIRQVALIAILAQMGSFVPAESAHIGVIDKVFSRVGASDDLARGQSTFMVEMSETANILNNATSRSLIILDEIGRGTSTYDGISIAWSVAEYLLKTENKRAKTLFATHYWELTKMEEKIPGAVNYQVAVEEAKSEIVFLHKIVRGGTDKSYGVHVARLAGLPYAVIKCAEEMLINLERENRKPSAPKKLVEQTFLPLTTKPPAIKELEKIDPNKLTPMQALEKLFDLKKLTSE